RKLNFVRELTSFMKIRRENLRMQGSGKRMFVSNEVLEVQWIHILTSLGFVEPLSDSRVRAVPVSFDKAMKTWPESSFYNLQRILWVPIVSIFASIILDRLTTFLGLSLGFVESNPAQAW